MPTPISVSSPTHARPFRPLRPTPEVSLEPGDSVELSHRPRPLIGLANLGWAQALSAAAAAVPLVGPGVALPQRVPVVEQDPFLRCTCGPSSLEGVLRYWQPGRSAVVPDEMLTTYQAMQVGTALNGPTAPCFLWNDFRALAAVAQANGLNAKVETNVQIDATRNQLAEWVARGETVIVWRLLDGSIESGHYTVIDGVDSVGVHMMDPWCDSPAYDHVLWSTFQAQFKNPVSPNGMAIRVGRLPIY